MRTQKQREEGEERDAANHSGRGKSIALVGEQLATVEALKF